MTEPGVHPPRRLTRRRLASLTALLAGLLVGAGAVLVHLRRPPGNPQIQISIDGRGYRVSPGRTLAAALASSGRAAHDGSLLSVSGEVIEPAAYPGSVTLNGRAVSPQTTLQPGARILIVQGRDHVEPLVRVRRRVAGEPGNPMFTLAETPGYTVILRGRYSAETASRSFHPIGPPRVPRAVALTFDDGPSLLDTRPVLRVLRRFHVRATFFLVGNLAKAQPALVRQELQAGMTVGDHSWDHPLTPPFATLGRRRIGQEIQWPAQVIHGLGGAVRLFRPPGGSTSPAVVRAAGRFALRTVLWSVDPRDWVLGTSAARIRRRVLSAARPGSIVLLHDGGGNRNATVSALPGIIRGLRHRGLRLVAIPVRPVMPPPATR